MAALAERVPAAVVGNAEMSEARGPRPGRASSLSGGWAGAQYRVTPKHPGWASIAGTSWWPRPGFPVTSEAAKLQLLACGFPCRAL